MSDKKSTGKYLEFSRIIDDYLKTLKNNTPGVDILNEEKRTFRRPLLDYSMKSYDDSKSPNFSEDGWRICTPESLRGHIVRAHFQARTLASSGVARYDIEVASFRMIPLDWVVRQAYKRLERSDEDIASEIIEHSSTHKSAGLERFSPRDYREAIVRNLKFIEQLNCAKVDWARVENSLEGAVTLDFDIDRDGRDLSFFKYDAPRRNEWRRYALNAQTPLFDKSFEFTIK